MTIIADPPSGEPMALALTASDADLIGAARQGDNTAFAELWRRHARSGVTVARRFSSRFDPEDVVSEAFIAIYQTVLSGGGPTGAFRPYLYTVIRNLASKWGRGSTDVSVDDIDDVADARFPLDPAMIALDRSLTVRAFRALPDRWQSVLWYTEVEGMDPHEVAPILGISANGVAALAYRAREGLRTAWLQAHVSDATAEGNCRYTIARLGDHARRGLTVRERVRVDEHLIHCAKCTIINEEVEDVGSRLALVMVPFFLGAGIGGALVSSVFGAPTAAFAASSALPAIPIALSGAGASATAVSLSAVGSASVSVAGGAGVAASAAATGLAAAGTGVAVLATTVVGGVLLVAVMGTSSIVVPANSTSPTSSVPESVAQNATDAGSPTTDRADAATPDLAVDPEPPDIPGSDPSVTVPAAPPGPGPDPASIAIPALPPTAVPIPPVSITVPSTPITPPVTITVPPVNLPAGNDKDKDADKDKDKDKDKSLITFEIGD